MRHPRRQRWLEVNRHYLRCRVALVRAALERHAQVVSGAAGDDLIPADTLARELEEARRALPAPAALDRLSDVFELSDFEQSVLLLSAGGELDSTFAHACGAASGQKTPAAASFALALEALPNADWAALTPVAALRYWRLLDVDPDGSLTAGTLRIDERVLHFLQGVSYLDARLSGLIAMISPLADLSSAHQQLAGALSACIGRSEQLATPPVFQLCGSDTTGKRDVAAAGCALHGIQLHLLRTSDLPPASAERAALSRLWHREALLSNSALLVEHDAPGADASVLAFIERLPGLVFVASREPVVVERATIRLEVSKPSAVDQRVLWEAALGDRPLNGHLAALTSQFDLNGTEIQAASVQALAASGDGPDDDLRTGLWSACRMQTRRHLRELVQHIEPAATWADLVLPEQQLQTLRDMVAQIRHRTKVYGEWGFASQGSRGLGIGALFAGASGTGKTLAAEVVAGELQLDLFRIDLSQVVSKYIGETEKNLRRVFDGAQDGAAVLLFDEADALFGKRSDVKDSHDRYANIEVSYLLQRMEAYRGLAILTTNMKGLIDGAFLRRLRFIVQFPFPDAAQRTDIWRTVFPAALPLDGVSLERLGQLNVSGGSIRNIALHASFYAADAGEPVRMSHLLRAAHAECAKLEKGVSPQEVRGWA